MAETDERRRSAEAERDAARSVADLQQHNLLGRVIAEACQVGAGLHVKASVFNALARDKGCSHGLKVAMEKRGYKQKTILVAGNAFRAYVGLASR